MGAGAGHRPVARGAPKSQAEPVQQQLLLAAPLVQLQKGAAAGGFEGAAVSASKQVEKRGSMHAMLAHVHVLFRTGTCARMPETLLNARAKHSAATCRCNAPGLLLEKQLHQRLPALYPRPRPQ